MYKSVLLRITKALYPIGRAFWIPINSIIEKIHNALIESENDVIEAGDELLNSILPDNSDFTTEDATLWELRLGLTVDASLSIAVRKSNILEKLQYPGDKLPRNHYLWMQKMLVDAGFGVYVHENRVRNSSDTTETISAVFAYDTLISLAQSNIANVHPQVSTYHFKVKQGFVEFVEGIDFEVDYILGKIKVLSTGIIDNTVDLNLAYNYWTNNYYVKTLSDLGITTTTVQHGNYQSGNIQHSQQIDIEIIANTIDEEPYFAFGDNENLRASFYIGGSTMGDYANVLNTKKDELRELILKLKPAHTAGYLLINYV